MSTFNKLRVGVAAAGFGAAMLLAPVFAQAKEVNIRVQAVLGMQTTEVKMLKDFMADLPLNVTDKCQKGKPFVHCVAALPTC